MTGLKPFWYYYGAKNRAALRYPRPLYDTIIEPFAGAAGYAMRYPERRVIIVEKYAVIAAIWRYLITADPAEIRATPADIDTVDALPEWVPQGLRWLIGFSMNDAATSPCRTLSSGRKSKRANGSLNQGWSTARRERVASQVSAIRHWTVIEGGLHRGAGYRCDVVCRSAIPARRGVL
jgi:hypothetical protein